MERAKPKCHRSPWQRKTQPGPGFADFSQSPTLQRLLSPGTQENNVRSQPVMWRQCEGNKSQGSCGEKAIVPKNLNYVTLLLNGINKTSFPKASASLLQLPAVRVGGTEWISALFRGWMFIIKYRFNTASLPHGAEWHHGVGPDPAKGLHPMWGHVDRSEVLSVPVPGGKRAAHAPR